MCGIFGYLNWNHPVERSLILRYLLNGLSRLEYRGYDSAGVAFDDADGATSVVKTNGNVAKLIDLLQTQGCLSDSRQLNSHVGIAHTRWATHGPPSIINSHPQRSDDSNEFVVVHNGIITNYLALKETMMAHGVHFESDTDTEVFAKLLKFIRDRDPNPSAVTLPELVREACNQLDGSFAFLVKSRLYPHELVATRKGSPLIVGISGHAASQVQLTGKSSALDPLQCEELWQNKKDGALSIEYFLSSDPAAIIEHTKFVLYLEDDDILHIQEGHMRVYRRAVNDAGLHSLQQTNRGIQMLKMQLDAVMKGKYEHFMQKEIFEQPQAVMTTMRGRVLFDKGEVRLRGIIDRIDDILSCRRVIFLACGTSFHACLASRQIFEELTSLPVSVELASEYVDRKPAVFRDELYVFLSQSGETADTLRALRYVKKRGAMVCGVTNTVGSAISRETDFGVHVNAGIEIGVASTKAYTCQIVSIVLMALQLSEDSVKLRDRRLQIIRDLERLPSLIEETLNKCEPVIKKLAEELKGSNSILVFGRGYQYSTALEGALKIKEISYIHSEGLSSSELKHGPIALISADMPSILLCTKDELYKDAWSALEQVCARHGNVIAICNEGDEDVRGKAQRVIEVPHICDALAGIVNVLPLQLLSYHLAVMLGRNVDQPRNLAKSVVV